MASKSSYPPPEEQDDRINEMSERALFYKAEFYKALKLEFENKYNEAMAICWELRMKKDLTIYRRARLNAFMAIIVDPRQNNPKIFAQECINLCRELRQNWIFLPEKESVISNCEKSSQEIFDSTPEQLEAKWTVVSDKD